MIEKAKYVASQDKGELIVPEGNCKEGEKRLVKERSV